MKAAAVIVAVFTVLGRMHATVGHADVSAMWLVIAAELAAAAVLGVLIRRSARWRMRRSFA